MRFVDVKICICVRTQARARENSGRDKTMIGIV